MNTATLKLSKQLTFGEEVANAVTHAVGSVAMLVLLPITASYSYQIFGLKAAVGMSESIAFSMLVVLFSVLFGRLIWIFGRSLKLIVRRTPLSALDSAGGALIGFVTGVAFVCILLIVLQWLFPITYTSLGYLSPERVKHTLLLKQLVDVLPIAI